MLSFGQNLKMILVLAVMGISVLTTYAFAESKKAAKDSSADSVTDELRLSPNDEQGNEAKSIKTELLISRTDEKALAQLKKLMAKYKGSSMEASLNFRLAELYIRRAKTATFFEVQRDNGESGAHFTPKEIKSQSSRQWIMKAVSTYDGIQKRFTHFSDMDLVLFNNAFARQMLGQEKEPMRLYKLVVENYVDSPLIADCHLAIGESYFSQKNFQKAYDEFQEIRKFADSRVYPYGIYKGAWALYNLSRIADGLKQLEEVVDYSKKKSQDGEHSSHLDLQHEALEDMVVFYEDVRKPGNAVSYFRDEGGDSQYTSLILRLGRLYQRHSRYQQMEIVYTDLLSHAPLAPERAQMHKDLLTSYEMQQKRDKAIVELESFAEVCRADSKWYLAQKPAVRLESREDLIEVGTLNTAKWHKDFTKFKAPLLAQISRRAYEALLLSGVLIPEEDKLRFSYAELLFQTDNFRKSSQQYSLVAHMTKDKKTRHDSAYAALVSLEKDTKEKWSDADEELFAKLAQDYVSLNPNGQYVTDVKFKKAFIAYEKGKFDRAAPELRELAIKFSQTGRGKKAAQLYLDILNLQKHFEILKDEALYFASKLSFDKETKLAFIKIHQQAYFTLVQGLEQAKKYPEAALGYAQFNKENPSSDLADKALFNAVRCAQLSGDYTQSAQLAEMFLKQFPQSTNKLEVVKNLVALYETQAQLGQAGDKLQKLSELDVPHRLDHLLTAADYKALNNEWSKALQIYTELAQKHPASVEGKTALGRMEELSEKNALWDKSAKLLKEISESGLQPQASIASLKITKRSCDAGMDEDCFRLAKKVLNQRNDDKVSRFALAQARLLQGKVLEKEFDMTGVKAKSERLGLVLKIKVDKLQRVQSAYQDVLNFSDKPSAIEALVKLAGIYAKFSNSLHTIEAPTDLPQKEKEKFLSEIENIALPMEEKNAETLQLALKQAKDMKIRDGTIAQIQSELNRLTRKSMKTKLVVDITTPENVLPVVN